MPLHELPPELLRQIALCLAAEGKPAPLVRMGMVNRAMHLLVGSDLSLWRTYWVGWLRGLQPPRMPNNLFAYERMDPLDIDYDVMLLRKVALVQMRHDALTSTAGRRGPAGQP